ncbi:hypothetical protein N431DRAFT_486492 [Stipitochalara longipes BDJ]|nr:hypothetical protein N431DRAFT_486492 [Stipitochalara longipes BDJ]
MVNIAGRSRGCSTCRRRRVKCDEKRPICNRCERCGFECGGMKGIAFIDCRKSMKSVKNKKHNDVGSTARDFAGTTSCPTSASLRGFELQIYICYTKQYLLRGGPVELALQDLQPDDLHTATNSTSDAHLFHLSILSLTTLFFGTQHRNTSITTYGYHFHGFALKKLNSALSDPECQFRDDVLLSVIVLVLQEAFMPTGNKYFLKHTTGLERLLELRGPGMLCSPEALLMFKSVRKMIILASMHRREPSILARDEWKDILWDDESVEGQADKYLFDVLADYTVLVSEHDQLLHNGELEAIDAIKQRDNMTRRAQDLLEHLYLWKAGWDTYAWDTHLQTTTSTGIMPPETYNRNALPSSTLLTSQIPSMATTLMLYNTCLIYILQILSSLSPLPNPSSPHSTRADYKALQQSAAHEITHCIPHHQAYKAHLDPGSMTVAHLAIRTAFMTFGGSGSLGGEWLMRLLGIGGGEVFARGLWGD